MRRVAIPALLAAAATAQAEIVGVVDSSTGRILLHDTKGPCVGHAHAAEFVAIDGARVAGCWVSGGPMVMVVFFDADIARIPIVAIKPPKAI